MPKNNKVATTITIYHISCSCGFRKDFNDEKTWMSGTKRHYKYCDECKEDSIEYEYDRYKVSSSTKGKMVRTDIDAVNFFGAVRNAKPP